MRSSRKGRERAGMRSVVDRTVCGGGDGGDEGDGGGVVCWSGAGSGPDQIRPRPPCLAVRYPQHPQDTTAILLATLPEQCC